MHKQLLIFTLTLILQSCAKRDVYYISLLDVNTDIQVIESGPQNTRGYGIKNADIPMKYELNKDEYTIYFYLDTKLSVVPSLGIHVESQYNNAALGPNSVLINKCAAINRGDIISNRIHEDDLVLRFYPENCIADTNNKPHSFTLTIFEEDLKLAEEEIYFEIKRNGYEFYHDAL